VTQEPPRIAAVALHLAVAFQPSTLFFIFPANFLGAPMLDRDNQDCLDKREQGEPMFIILGRDPDGGHIVRTWAERRRAAGDEEHALRADVVADAMDIWRDQGHVARTSPAPEEYPKVELPGHVAAAIIHAAETFEDYGRQHRAKNTPEANVKADRNFKEAELLRRLLA
jgi:hypothetical protein